MKKWKWKEENIEENESVMKRNNDSNMNNEWRMTKKGNDEMILMIMWKENNEWIMTKW